ncbi:SLAC1 anion channel family protein [Pseudoduganella aquatica]|uniref:C4-dicarboxylate ABC transporter n=1 Tax=Pseudoduganella aquatica TaxID=2660641 RepID=A0A7X4KMP5_9BURK|nr:SLAC1 anion channel family protein [Pseudoduganella aquatica]MYN08065.1 C4-dicarboxylate ABC transporter [Pseudoduganella aquatica]
MQAANPNISAAALPAGRSSIQHLPVNLFASVMGLSGLALAWRLAAKTFGADIAIANGIGMLAITAFLLLAAGYLVKAASYPDAVCKEFTHPVAGNFFGTITISLLLLSTLLDRYSPVLQQAVWTMGVASTIVLSFIVVNRLLRGSAATGSAVPAWLIPGVATLDIAVTGATMPMPWAYEVNMLAVAIGSVLAVVFFVLIFSRLVHSEALPAGMTPSLMILIAPFEVGFLAYVNLMHQADMFASMLFYFGLFMFVVVSLRVFRPSVRFAASWWAIGFPLAALSNAALKYADATGSGVHAVLAAALLAFLTGAIATLLVRTLHALFTGKLLTA